MKELKNTSREDRLRMAAEARSATLAKFKPKAAAPDPAFEGRKAERAAELEAVRRARAEAKEAARLAVIEPEHRTPPAAPGAHPPQA